MQNIWIDDVISGYRKIVMDISFAILPVALCSCKKKNIETQKCHTCKLWILIFVIWLKLKETQEMFICSITEQHSLKLEKVAGSTKYKHCTTVRNLVVVWGQFVHSVIQLNTINMYTSKLNTEPWMTKLFNLINDRVKCQWQQSILNYH